jgi:hypothetical protein
MSSIDAPFVTDPLEQGGRPERLHYATGVLLQADDFRAEQTYHRSRLATALRHLLGFGTIAGLAVRAPEAGDNELELRVEPGLALDRYGRLLELTTPYCLRLSRWFAAEETPALRAAVHRDAPQLPPVAVVADLFMSAAACGVGKTPSFASGPFDALDAVVPSRLSEQPQLKLVMRAESGAGGIPTPANFWPAADADREALLTAILGSFDTGIAGEDEVIEPLAEHVGGEDLSAVLLARIAIPVQLAADAPAGTRPLPDLAQRVRVDNGVRPFIAVPGKWLGRAPAAARIVDPEE